MLGGDGGEGGGFAGLHVDAAEVDGAVEGALDGGLEEVEFAHGDAAGGDYDVDAGEGGAERGFEGTGSGWVSLVRWGGVGKGILKSGGRTCLIRYLDRRLQSCGFGSRRGESVCLCRALHLVGGVPGGCAG